MVLRTARTVASLLIAALLAPSVGTATAHAVDSNVLFLRELRQQGIGYGDPNATADMGRDICRQFDEGSGYPQVQAAAQTLPGGIQLSPNDAAVVIKAATDTMCPQFADRLPH
jgi:Protein of unknown function (DUF732)